MSWLVGKRIVSRLGGRVLSRLGVLRFVGRWFRGRRCLRRLHGRRLPGGMFGSRCGRQLVAPDELPQLRAAMAAVAEEPWAKHIWHRDPRFADFLPKVDATGYAIATGGSLEDQRVLWGNLDALRAAL